MRRSCLIYVEIIKKNFIIKKGLVQKEVPVKRRKILYLRKSRSNGCQERQQQDYKSKKR